MNCRIGDTRRSLRRVLALTVAFALCAPGVALGQAIDDRPRIELGLRDVLAMAMDRNLDIAVQRYEIDLNESQIDNARAAYDSTLTSTYYEEQINNQNANPFFGFPVVEQKTRSFTSQWNDPTIWGGTFDIRYQGNKQKTNFLQLLPQYQNFLTFTYTQSLLRNFGMDVNRTPIHIAQNNTKISSSQFADVVMTTLEQAEFAYWDLVFARLDLRVQRQSLILAEELLRMNRAKVQVGTMAPIDVTQAEAGVADRVEGVIVAEAAVYNAEDALRQIMNPDPTSTVWTSAIVPTDEPTFREFSPDMEAALETARANRPDLEQQRLTVENNALQEVADKKNKQWDLQLLGRYTAQGLTGRLTICNGTGNPFLDGQVISNQQEKDECFAQGGMDEVLLDESYVDAIKELRDTAFGDWRIEATLVIPIGNRDLKARHAQSMLRHRQSQVRLDQTLLAAEIDVRTRVRDVTTNVNRVKAARKNRELQEENVDAEQKKFENGMSTSFTVLQVQDALRSAERRENLAIVDYNKSLASLEKAKGTLLEARNIEMSDIEAEDTAIYYEGPLRTVDLQALMNGGGRGD